MSTIAIARHRIGIVRLAVAGGVTSLAVFVLCWVGTFIPTSSPTHAYLGLFTRADISTVGALAEGGFWALGFGALVGALFGAAYNLLGALER